MGKNLSAALGWCGRAMIVGAMLVGLGMKPAEATVFFQWTQISGTMDEPYNDGRIPLLTGWVAISDWAFKSGISAYSEKENETYDSMAPDWRSVGLEGIYFAVDDLYGGGIYVTLSNLFNQQ